MEFVIVRYPTDRFVYIDGEQDGRTNKVLRVDTGTHAFSLGPVANYRPASRRVTVQNTTVLEPLEITFNPADDQ